MSALTERMARGEFTLIAEIGVNYYDIAKQRGVTPMEAAKLMCQEARDAGIHAVKFQTYKAVSYTHLHDCGFVRGGLCRHL